MPEFYVELFATLLLGAVFRKLFEVFPNMLLEAVCYCLILLLNMPEFCAELAAKLLL